MSSGHGHLQRALLAIIDGSDGLLSTRELTMATEAQTGSVRRSLRKLAGQDRIVAVGRGWHDRNARWASKTAFAAYEARKTATFGIPGRR
jgi:hypothetical protein